jgi:ATP-binding cassette subfamily B protein RaxB
MLSSGQRQLIAFLRAYVSNPSILILDEATSHLDMANEILVSRALQLLNLTRIVIAHRPETIASAQRQIHLTPTGIQEVHSPAALTTPQMNHDTPFSCA